MKASKTPLRLVAAIAAAAAVAAVPVASATVDRGQTTEPTNFEIYAVNLRSGGVSITPESHALTDTTGEFKITNRSGKSRRFEIAGRETKLIKAKAQTIFFLL